MLQSMREFAHSWVVKGMMLFLVLSFSIWGIGDIFRGNPLGRTVAKAGSVKITVQDLNRKFEEMLAEARRTVNPEITPQEAKKLGLLDKTLDSEVKRSLVDQDIKRLGIAVDPQAVIKMVGEQPQFRNKDGSFNKDLFHVMLEQQGLNERSFVTQGQQDLERQVLLGALGGSHTVPQTEVDALYKARAQKRILDVVTIDPTKMGDVGMPDDKALKDYYDKNPTLFTAPEYRGMTIAVLSTDAMAKDISISDDQLKQAYEDKKVQLANPEQRDIVQVVVQDEGKAKELAQQAKSNGDLMATAKKAGENPVPLDLMEQKNLLPELAMPVFALSAGQVGDPVKTQLGWHVIQVKKIVPAGTPSFDEAKDKLRTDMQRDQAVEAATRTVNEMDDELAAGNPLESIADKLKLKLIKVTAIDAAGLMPSGKEPSDLPMKQVLLKDAFAQNSGETSPVEDDKEGDYYVVRTDEITPSALKPLDQVKDLAVAAWKSHEQINKAQAQMDKIAQDLRDGKPLASFAGPGVSTRVSLPLSQLGDTDPLLPPSIVSRALKTKKGETVMAAGDRNQVVARVAQVIDADPSAKDPRKNTILGQVRKNQSEEILDEYVAHLYDVFPVKIDHDLVDHLRQQDN